MSHVAYIFSIIGVHINMLNYFRQIHIISFDIGYHETDRMSNILYASPS